MLSVIIVSRNRPTLLRNAIESVQRNSSKVELWVGYDLDDEPTRLIAEEMGCFTAGAPRDVNRHASLLNPIVAKTCGDYIMGLNDDAEIRTPNFDDVISNSIESFLKDRPDRIAYGRGQEVWPWPNVKEPWEASLKYKYACYPILTREVVNALGYFMPPQISGPGADIMFARIFASACENRLVDIPVEIYDSVCEIKENHAHYNIYSGRELKRDIEKINEAINCRS